MPYFVGPYIVRTTGIFLDFIWEPVSNHRAVHRIGSHISAAGKTVLVPAMPVYGWRHREQMEVTPRQFRPALFQWRDVIHYEEPASVRCHNQIVRFLDELDVIDRDSGEVALDLRPVRA